MSDKMILKNVRLSFPSIFNKASFNGVETKYEATFLINKDTQSKLIAEIEANIKKVIDEKFPMGKPPKNLKMTCFQDGDMKDYDGYEGMMALKATSKKRPQVFDRDKTPLVEDDANAPYAGCFVNSIVDFWYSSHPAGGNQILCNLYGIQFAKNGDAFGSGNVDVSDAFDEIDDEDEPF